MKKTICEITRLGAEYLARHGVGDSLVESEYLVSSVLNLGRTELYAKGEQCVGEETLVILRRMMTDRAKGKPVSYLTGRRDFYGLEFFVDEKCLIPRHETEILVEEVIKYADRISGGLGRDVRILDIGCGCGNICVSVAKHVERASVCAVDIEYGAVLKTCQNALVNGVYGKITAYCGDLFSPFENTAKFLGYFDVIISNPPYVPDDEIVSLQREIVDYEPRRALAGGADGLEFYRRIIPKAEFYLAPGGILFFEIGSGQKRPVENILAEHGYGLVKTVKDYGGIERVISASSARPG